MPISDDDTKPHARPMRSLRNLMDKISGLHTMHRFRSQRPANPLLYVPRGTLLGITMKDEVYPFWLNALSLLAIVAVCLSLLLFVLEPSIGFLVFLGGLCLGAVCGLVGVAYRNRGAKRTNSIWNGGKPENAPGSAMDQARQ
jgi:hypothetical protein